MLRIHKANDSVFNWYTRKSETWQFYNLLPTNFQKRVFVDFVIILFKSLSHWFFAKIFLKVNGEFSEQSVTRKLHLIFRKFHFISGNTSVNFSHYYYHHLCVILSNNLFTVKRSKNAFGLKTGSLHIKIRCSIFLNKFFLNL